MANGSDGEVIIDTSLDTTGIEKDLKKLPKKIKDNTKDAKIETALDTTKAEKDLSKLKKNIDNTKDIKIDATLDSADLDNGLNQAKNEASNLNEELKKVNNTINQTKTGDSYKKIKNSMTQAEKQAYKLERQMQKLKAVLGGDIPQATQEAYTNIYKMNQEIRQSSRHFGSYSPEVMKARNALNEYVLGLDDVTFKQVYMRSQLGLSDAQLQQQANSIKLNARMMSLMGSQTDILTKRMEGLQKFGIKPKDMLPASTIGQFQMLNETIKASGNPIYALSAGYRAFGANIEKSIKGWSAQKMAVKLAGDDMTKYGLLLRGITAAQMNMAMAFPIVGIAAVLAYGKMFSSALEADEKLKALSETVKNKLGQAFKPLVDVAGSVLKVILELTGKVADMMIKFNELHPVISKVIATIGFLLPAMTLLFLPLSMGIGLLNGWKVAINGVWVLMGGAASAIGVATSTFLALAVVIGAVVGAFIYLFKTNETFRNAVIPIWEKISSVGQKVFSGLANIIGKGFEGVVSGVTSALNGMVTLFMVTLPNAFKEGGFSGLLDKIGEILSNLVNTISSKSSEIFKSASELIGGFISAIQEKLPGILAVGSKILTNLLQGITSALPSIIEKMNETRLIVLDAIKEILPKLVQYGIQIITTLVKGIADTLPELIKIAVEMLTLFLDTITNNLSMIIDVATTALMTFVNGIVEALPHLTNIAVDVILAFVNGLLDNLPTLIDSAIKIIDTLIEGMMKATPKILEAVFKINVALAEGLIKAIPKLLAAIPVIFNAIVTGFMGADWAGLGSQILTKIISILQPIFQPVVDFFVSIWTAISTFFTDTLPTFFTNLWTTISTIFQTGWNNIVNFFTVSIPTWIESVGTWFMELPGKIAYALGYALGTVVQWGVGVWLYLSENVPLWIEGVNKWFSELPGKVKAWFDNIINNIKQWGIDTYNELSTNITNTINSIDKWFSELPGKIKAWFDKVINDFKTWGTNMYNEASTSISNLITSVEKWFSEMPGKIKAWFDKTITDLSTWGTNMYNTASTEVTNIVTSIEKWFGELPDKMRTIGSKIVSSIKEGISSAWESMSGWMGGLINNFVQGVKDSFSGSSSSSSGGSSESAVDGEFAKGTRYNRKSGMYEVDEKGFELTESSNSVAYVDKGAAISNHMQSKAYVDEVVNSEVSALSNKLMSAVNYEVARTTASISANSNRAANISTSKTVNNDNGINLNIENFNNNSNQDIEDISNNLAFLGKKNVLES